jgi:SAM-dependent methyltransferase
MDLRAWDEKYRGMDAAAAEPATPLVARIACGVKSGRALDLACGSGRDAVWLAEHGWSVTAVDGAPAAIDIVKRRAPAIDARIADLEMHEFAVEPNAWDLILMCRYLQRDLFEEVNEGVVPGGIVIATALMGQSRFSVEPGELRSYFAGWEILHNSEGALAEIAARRPAR